MNKKLLIRLFFMTLFLIGFSQFAEAHVKWFVEFDVAEPPQKFFSTNRNIYYLFFFFLSIYGVVMAHFIDTLWTRKFGNFNFFEQLFSEYEDVGLNIARIGTGIFFISIWLMGGLILTPELLTNNPYVPTIQLLIAGMVLFKRTLVISGIGILCLYAYAIQQYGIFHLMDYTTFIGLGLYLIFSSFKSEKLQKARLPVLYIGLIFAFLWSAIEKIAYPQWFYVLLNNNPGMAMGLDPDFFIGAAAFVEFTLFFLLLVSRNGVYLVAILVNLVIISGNIYFGKMDAIGHFPVNFILFIMLINGPLRTKISFMKIKCDTYPDVFKKVFVYYLVLIFFISLYYGLHWLIYG